MQKYAKKSTQNDRRGASGRERAARQRKYRNIAKCRKTNPKLYFSYVKRAKKNKSRFGPLKNDDSEFVIDPKDQAETMNEFFSSVFTRSDGDPPAKTAINGNVSLSDAVVTEEKVKFLIDGMREYSAPGPDNIPPILLKTMQDEVATPLTLLFQKSMAKYQTSGGKQMSPRFTRKEAGQNRAPTEG